MPKPTTMMTTTSDPRRAFATDVVARLQGAGFRALWAGGCVRDLILGEEPADFDVATDATPEQVSGLFRRTVLVGVSYGVVRVQGPPRAGEVEVATFRSDGAYLDGRRPESVTFSTPEADAARRDFTINGMFLNPIDGELLDFVGGRADLDAKVLRAIGDPAERFAEDKLRLLRAARFASRFGLNVDPATRAAIVAMAGEVTVVAAERIAQELRKMLVHPSRAVGMALAADLGLVAAILPDLEALRGRASGEAGRDVPDPWHHTLAVLDALPSGLSFPLAFAALLLEAGEGPGEASRVADRVARGLKLANAERERAVWLVAHHREPAGARSLRVSSRKRLLAQAGVGELLTLARAEAIASGKTADAVEDCETYRRTEPEGPMSPPPLLNGHDLSALGLRPGPGFKTLLDEVYDAQLDGDVRDKTEALEWVKQRHAGA